MIFPSLSTPSPQQQLDNTVARLKLTVYTEFNGLVETHNDWVRLVFENFPYDPTVIVDALNASNDSVPLFTATTDLRAVIKNFAATQNLAVSSFPVPLLYPLSAYSISGSTITLIPSAYSGV